MGYNVQFSGVKLLVIDDDRAVRAVVLQSAGAWGYEVEEAANAETALERLEKARYNIVLTDIKMGKMDGITFAAKIRERMPSMAVVIMTGYPTSKTAKQSQEMGAVYYLQKPVSAEALGETLRIATSWNIGMLIQRAAQRFLALKKGEERDRENRLKAIKGEIRRYAAQSGSAQTLRDFVYSADFQKTDLFKELAKRFASDAVKPF